MPRPVLEGSVLQGWESSMEKRIGGSQGISGNILSTCQDFRSVVFSKFRNAKSRLRQGQSITALCGLQGKLTAGHNHDFCVSVKSSQHIAELSAAMMEPVLSQPLKK